MSIEFLPEKSFPQNLESGFPVGQSFYLAFSNSVDLKTLKKSCVLFGKDFDRSTGPENALSLNISDATNPFFLKSPGLHGFIECDFEEYFVENFEDENESEIQYLTEVVETKNTIVKVTPKQILGENQKYTLFILGKTSETINGNIPEYSSILNKNETLSKRTIYDSTKNEIYDERVKSRGSFESKNGEDTSKLKIKIVEAGQGSKAKFIWWFSDEQEPLAGNQIYKKRLNRCMQRWRSLERGILLKFTESLYDINEIFEVNCYKREELLESYIINFETNTDSVFEYPDSISESPIGLGVGFANNLHGFEIEEDPLIITNISPYNGSINNKLDTKEIVITFNKVLDVNSVNQESVKLTAYPVSGSFDYKDNRMKRERVLSKIVSVEENKIIIEL